MPVPPDRTDAVTDLRGAMEDGYDADLVNRTFDRIFTELGVRLVCRWDYRDGLGYGGDSWFYVEANGRFHELIGDLWAWLNGDPDDPDTPAYPGAPDLWLGPAVNGAFEARYGDGLHNFSTRDLSGRP